MLHIHTHAHTHTYTHTYTHRGYMFDRKIMPSAKVDGVRADAASVESFFQSVCAPG
jgi:hypothetical protein